MASSSRLQFQVRPVAPCSVTQRRLRFVAKDRPLLPREVRSARWGFQFVFSSHASTDSSESELAADPAVEDAKDSAEQQISKEAAPAAKLPSVRPPRRAIEEVEVGEVLDGIVRNVVSFGCFVDANCVVDVFIHVSDFGNFYVENSEDYVERGMKVKLRLTECDEKLKGTFQGVQNFTGKESQSSTKRPQRRRTPEDTRTYNRDEEFSGVITKLLRGGAFVSFDNGRSSGFLPVEEIPEGRKDDIAATEILKEDEELIVRVIGSDQKSGRLTLSMRSLEELEDEQMAFKEGFFIEDEGDDGGAAILSAAFKRAGIVRDMFADVASEAKKTVQSVKEVKAVGSSGAESAEAEKIDPLLAKSPEVETVKQSKAENLESAELDKESASSAVAVKQDTPEETSFKPTSSISTTGTLSTEENKVEDTISTSQPVTKEESELPKTALELPVIDALPQESVAESKADTIAPMVEPEIRKEISQEPFSEPVAEVQTKTEQKLETQATEQTAFKSSLPEIVPVSDQTSQGLTSELEVAGVKDEPEKEVIETKLKPETVQKATESEQSPSAETVQASSPTVETKEPVVKSSPPEGVSDVKKQKSTKTGITASLVKELREMTGAGMMDCKKALTESNGNMDAAVDYLKKKGIAKAAKRSGKVASEGLIASYIHMGSKLGILVEVNSETDFVARTDAFKEFVDNVAMTIASCPDVLCVSPDDFPSDVLEKEKQIEMEKEDILSKPEAIREKIVSGRLKKTQEIRSVLAQPFIQDQEISVQDALTKVSASLGEKISIRRFERFELGEGLEKKSTDLAAEVADQIESKKAEAATKADPVVEQPSIPTEPVIKVPAAKVKELREMTGGGMMDCKKALAESGADLEKAAEYLRKKGLAGAAKKAGRLAAEGVVCSYIHLGSKLGIMAEVNCETDFVARGETFKQLAEDIAMQVAACPEVEFISEDAIPQDVIEKEITNEMQKEDLQEKPEAIRQKIAEGRAKKTIKEMCLFDQPFLKDTTKNVGEIVKEHIATLGENIKVRRFVRYNLGEGIQKKEENFAEEVAEQAHKSS